MAQKIIIPVAGSVWEKKGKKRKILKVKKNEKGEYLITWKEPGGRKNYTDDFSFWAKWAKDASAVVIGSPGRGGVRKPGPGKTIGRNEGASKPEEEKRKAINVTLPPDLIEEIDKLVGPRLRSRFLEKSARLRLAQMKNKEDS